MPVDLLNLIHVTTDDILGLDQLSSVKFFEMLFRDTFIRHSLPLSGLTLQSNSNFKDQGVDASILRDIPNDIDFIPQGTSIFQFKSTSSEFDLKKNFIESGRTEEGLKPLIKKLLENGSKYIVIETKKVLTTDQKLKLEDKITLFLLKYLTIKDKQIRVYSADDIARWADQFVDLKIKFNKLKNARAFLNWKEDLKRNQNIEYFLTDELKSKSFDLINRLRFQDLETKYIQIKGLPGVGKRSFTAHTLDHLDDFTKSGILVIQSSEEDIGETLDLISHSGIKTGIIIFINVNSKIFREIYNKFEWNRDNEFKVIAIYDYQSYESDKYNKTVLITIEPLIRQDSEKLLNFIEPNLRLVLRNNILEIANGIPNLIIEIAALLKGNDFNIYDEISVEIFCEKIFESLLKNSGFDRALLTQILIGFSLFSELGWETIEYQEFTETGFAMRFQENKGLFINLLEIQAQEFQIDIITRYLLKKGILAMRGRFIFIKIRPLANFIIEKHVQEKKLISFVEKIQELNDTHFMEKFLERMKDLSYYYGNSIVKKLIESGFISKWTDFENPNPPLHQIIIPKSKIFLELTRIDNILTMDLLKKVFKDVSPQELKIGLIDRRNLIYALEHIVWYENTFKEGMNLLLKLALGENESYTNNASGVFRDIFSVFLPGTSASLKKRLDYLKSVQKNDEIEISKIMVIVIQHIFDSNQYRLISAEIQSIKPIPEEYKPISIDEIKAYFTGALDILKELINSEIEIVGNSTYEVFFQIIPELIENGFTKDVILLLRESIKKDGERYIKLIQFLKGLQRTEETRIQNKTDAFYNIFLNPALITDPSVFTIELLKKMEIQKRKSELQLLSAQKIEENLKDIIKNEIKRVRIFEEWGLIIREIENKLPLLDRVRLLLTDREYIFNNLEGMSYEDFNKKQAKDILSIIENNSEFWDIIRFLITSDELLVFYIGWALGEKDSLLTNWDKIKTIFINEKNSRKTGFISGYFTELRVKNPLQWIEKLKELKRDCGLIKELFDLGISTKRIDSWVIDITKELIDGKQISVNNLMKLAFRTEDLEEEAFIKLAQLFYENIDNPLAGLQRGRFDPNQYYDFFEFLFHYLEKNKSTIRKLESILHNSLLHIKNIKGHLNSISRRWRDLTILFVNEYPIYLEEFCSVIMGNLERFPTQYPDYDIEFVLLRFLNMSPDEVINKFADIFKSDYNQYYIVQFVFTHNFLERIPDERLIKICNINEEKIPALFGNILNDLVLKSNDLPSIVKNLLVHFPDNEPLHHALVYSFSSGVRTFLPGTEAAYDASAIKKLKKWKEQNPDDVIQHWLIKSIEYMEREFNHTRIRDEEDLRETQIEDETRTVEFYERYKWLNKQRGEYEGEVIAYGNIGGDWVVISHSKDEDAVYQEVNLQFETNKLEKNLKIFFKSYRDER